MIPAALFPLAHKVAGYAIYVLAGGAVAEVIDFTHTITLGTVLLAVVIGAIASLMTIRSKVASVWREEAEGAEKRLEQEKRSRAEFDRQQQELRHDLKDKIAGLTAQLKVMEAKTDLSAALESIREMNAELATNVAAQIADAMVANGERSEARDARTHELLEAIRDRLPDEKAA